MARNIAEDPRKALASMFIGMTIAFILLGVTCSQVIWYFRFQSSRSSKYMKCLILLIWLAETLDCVFMVCVLLHTFLGPAIARSKARPNKCRYWAMPAQKMASEVCTFFVEGFFITRMWRFSGKKKLTALAFIPYIISSGMAFAQIFYGLRLLCVLGAKSSNRVVVFVGFGFNMFADSVTVLTMCYMLYVRSVGFTRHTNTIKVVRGVILWIISTGLLTWFNSVLMLACFMGGRKLPYPSGIYDVRSGLYANSMLAQLNSRPRFQAIAEATVTHSIHLETMSFGGRANRNSRQGNDSILNPAVHDGSPAQT